MECYIVSAPALDRWFLEATRLRVDLLQNYDKVGLGVRVSGLFRVWGGDTS